jgi:hypothetical protein
MVAIALQIYPFRYAFPSEYVVASSRPLGESRIPKQTRQVIETNACIRTTTENSLQNLSMPAHA